MSVLEATRQWLRNCPLIQGNKINLQYLGDAPVAYSVSSAGEVFSYDVLGKAVGTYSMALYARLPWGADLLPNVNASEIFSSLAEWVRTADRARFYPEVEGWRVTRATTANAGMIVSADANAAQYQIQIQITAEEE